MCVVAVRVVRVVLVLVLHLVRRWWLIEHYWSLVVMGTVGVGLSLRRVLSSISPPICAPFAAVNGETDEEAANQCCCHYYASDASSRQSPVRRVIVIALFFEDGTVPARVAAAPVAVIVEAPAIV